MGHVLEYRHQRVDMKGFVIIKGLMGNDLCYVYMCCMLIKTSPFSERVFWYETSCFGKKVYACVLYAIHVGMHEGDWFLDWSTFFEGEIIFRYQY